MGLCWSVRWWFDTQISAVVRFKHTDFKANRFLIEYTIESRYLELGYLEFCDTRSDFMKQKYIWVAFFNHHLATINLQTNSPINFEISRVDCLAVQIFIRTKLKSSQSVIYYYMYMYKLSFKLGNSFVQSMVFRLMSMSVVLVTCT